MNNEGNINLIQPYEVKNKITELKPCSEEERLNMIKELEFNITIFFTSLIAAGFILHSLVCLLLFHNLSSRYKTISVIILILGIGIILGGAIKKSIYKKRLKNNIKVYYINLPVCEKQIKESAKKTPMHYVKLSYNNCPINYWFHTTKNKFENNSTYTLYVIEGFDEDILKIK